MRGRPGKVLRGAAMIVVLAMLTGCVVVRSLRGEKGPDFSAIQPGVKRSVVETALGLPLNEWVSPTNVRCALYEYNAGIPSHPGDAGTAALLDVVTFGIFEIITYKNNGWKHPGEYDRRRPKVVIAYDGRDVILGIFDEAAELPEDGRSAPYRWPRVSSLDRESPPAYRQSSTETVFAYDAPMIRQ
jgi:hypothetical protein